MRKKYYVVGSGITGSVIAHELAQRGGSVLVWEKRPHTGGNLFDYTDPHGIRVQAYGPHIFHTDSDRIWNYVNRLAPFEPFHLICGSEIDGKTAPVSFDFQAVDIFFPEEAETIKAHIAAAFPGQKQAAILQMLDSADPYVRKFARFLYEKDYVPYTVKQWGISPEEIDRSVFRRVPVLFSYGSGYFKDAHQGLPKHGYTQLINQLLAHKNISVITNTDALAHLSIREGKAIIDGAPADGAIVYTGPIDALFAFRYGRLPYRSLRFEWRYAETESLQPYPVVAYPQAEGYTRITEYKKLPEQSANGTSYAVEYPLPYSPETTNEPFYPVLTQESRAFAEKYRALAEETENLICCGRLADFRYYNMDEAIERALDVADSLEELA